MKKPMIEIEHISKRYRIGANKEPYLSLRDEIAKIASRLRPGKNHHGQSETDFWALSDVSFSVQEGEAVGIIGRNGAGKSTLLKILSQITPPTKGKITVRGRVASLLEVGTGFHPELTGRENVFLNGAILGMSREEIRRKFDEIVAFAEVEKFLDTPVKRYSSGMYVRLAFAVAAHLEPEILIVDEVLAVGDVQFQQKCLGKMGEVAKGGRTVLFVSHNMAAIELLCSRCALIHNGELKGIGHTKMVLNEYVEGVYLGMARVPPAQRSDRSGSGEVRLKDVYLVDQQGKLLPAVQCGDVCTIAFQFEFTEHPKPFHLSFTIRDSKGQYISRPSTYDVSFLPGNTPRSGILMCSINRFPLIPGYYRVTTEIRIGGEVADSRH
jgi:lipopolysaccharide transport system ATP-binding protein